MFREFLGLPAHALIVHAAVVFVPLQVASAIVYALVSASRRYLWWVVLGLAVVGPAAAWAARLSGNEYKAYWLSRPVPPSNEWLVSVNNHQSYGNNTSLLATGLGLVMLAMVLYLLPRPSSATGESPTPPNAVLGIATMVVIVALGAVTAYYVFKTGDSGARMVHPKIS